MHIAGGGDIRCRPGSTIEDFVSHIFLFRQHLKTAEEESNVNGPNRETLRFLEDLDPGGFVVI